MLQEIKYDRLGRMQYHPDFHPNHKKPWTVSDLEYLCKFWETDGMKRMAMALGRTEMTLATKVDELRKKGLFDYYKHLNKYW